jgi:hypothetical protein
MTNTKILLLVSDPMVRSVIGEALEHVGYVVVPTGDLGWAADWLKKCPSDPFDYASLRFEHAGT